MRQIASSIRTKLNSTTEIADGFELIAQAMEPCVDCQHLDEPDTAAPAIDVEDLPDSGMDNAAAIIVSQV